MPPAAHRLSLLLLAADPERPGDFAEKLFEALLDGGWIAQDGGPGPRPLVPGGFARARLETFDSVHFASSGQGGFAVRCPVTEQNVVSGFNRALEAWRAGAPRRLACVCGQAHDLIELHYAPQAGFARAWVALVDVQGVELTPEAYAEAERQLMGVRMVVRRG
ncbi:MAG: hypothetical protein Q8P18_19380 [Pseudomonadota bacterium]|nr:hypothetical protein [Pseudomonadota bacterium]